LGRMLFGPPTATATSLMRENSCYPKKLTPNVLHFTNTIGGIGELTTSAWVDAAEERGYREALLDVYCFLTGNEQVLDIEHKRLDLVLSMVEQAAANGDMVYEVIDEQTMVDS
jgi:hypothetical protein